MSEKYEILATSEWSSGGCGEYPFRFVVLKINDESSPHKYSRHMQVDDGKSPEFFIYGHHYFTFAEAFDDMRKSIIESNKNYPKGGVSHIPKGISGIEILNPTENGRLT